MKTGEYYLQGAMEVGSGLWIKPDFTFEFFYSYGMIDRIANGKWEQKGGHLVLNNTPKPEKDFILVSSSKKTRKQLVIQISDPNKMVVRSVYCQLQTRSGMVLEGSSDAHGVIVFDTAEPLSIALIHEFWPDRYSVFEIANPEENYFEFTIEPRIVDVEFSDLTLQIGDNMLQGPHPLLKGQEWTYVMS
ncbi:MULTISPECIES: hypothetical protein [Xanthocytophaga]|uniref:Uncharacterized protein n=2 Tax=Xanthocytophaga TaxID=3078918 RepID=A0AAE3QHR3_9BACT|nr:MULTISPECIES: hypothetical protein [Xanthocytophaga]MDJ1479587.1 hypothetical protein [Xanthocytophaga flavus]MDJ1501942.1 hypothetical protein [Xanthocytophaga agilis]